jgi:predicted transcriptional regulator
MTDAIISIKPRHVENIINKAKTVELRTRNTNLPVGSTLWIYSTLPAGKIEASAKISFVDTMSPKKIWEKYGKEICVSKSEFMEYTKNRELVTAIGLTGIESLQESLCLNKLRALETNFNPPQFISKLSPDRSLYSALYG